MSVEKAMPTMFAAIGIAASVTRKSASLPVSLARAISASSAAVSEIVV